MVQRIRRFEDHRRQQNVEEYFRCHLKVNCTFSLHGKFHQNAKEYSNDNEQRRLGGVLGHFRQMEIGDLHQDHDDDERRIDDVVLQFREFPVDDFEGLRMMLACRIIVAIVRGGALNGPEDDAIVGENNGSNEEA